MQTKTDIRIAVGLILLIQIITSFGSIALLNRMNALYQRHMTQNLVAIEAAEQAHRLGQDGAWAATFLAIASFILATLAYFYIQRRIILPIQELYETTYDYQQGNLYRRCTINAFSHELEYIAHTMNTFLDEHQFHASGQTPLTIPPLANSQTERTALLHLLDQNPNPTLLFDTDARIIAANKAAIDLQLSADPTPLSHATLLLKTSPSQPNPGFHITQLPQHGWLVEIHLDNI